MDESRAVIFDMDGVLVDTYRAHYRSWLEMAEPEGLHFSEAEFGPTFGRTSREIIGHFWGENRFDAEAIVALDARKEAAFRRIIEDDFPAMPGIVELLGTLQAEGFRLAVGSSGPRENVDMVLDRLGTRSLFGAVVTGNDVTQGKPDPQVFLLAAERLGVRPARCVVIEDAPAGVAAARAAGMACVGLLSTGRTPQDVVGACAVVRSLCEITPQLLRGLIDRRP
jgi:beta-phosphoglucomutase